VSSGRLFDPQPFLKRVTEISGKEWNGNQHRDISRKKGLSNRGREGGDDDPVRLGKNNR